MNMKLILEIRIFHQKSMALMGHHRKVIVLRLGILDGFYNIF